MGDLDNQAPGHLDNLAMITDEHLASAEAALAAAQAELDLLHIRQSLMAGNLQFMMADEVGAATQRVEELLGVVNELRTARAELAGAIMGGDLSFDDFISSMFPETESSNRPGRGSTAGREKLNAYEQLNKSLQEQIANLHLEAQSFGMAETEATRFRVATELLRAAHEAGMPVTEQLIDNINATAVAYSEVEERTRQLQQQQQLAIDINNTLAQGFSNMFTGIIDGSKNAGQAIGDLLKSLGQLLINNAFMMLFGGGTGGGIGGFLAPLFGGFRADGGPVQAGMTYLVGERGPELFMPHTSGQIIPNHSMRPANANFSTANDNSRGDLHIHINGSGLTEEQLGRAIANGIREYDGALAPKVEAKFRQMQSDPRAADGGW